MSKMISLDIVETVMMGVHSDLEVSRDAAIQAKNGTSNIIAMNLDDKKIVESHRLIFEKTYAQELAYNYAMAKVAYALTKLKEKAK